MHHLLVWGIVLDLISTSAAAVYHNVLGEESPYPYLSIPVVTGTIGGVMIVIGGVGLLRLKRQARHALASEQMLRLDYAFLVLLILTSVTGLVLMVLRSTAAAGTLLTVHLGVIAALYLSLPYSKFAHVVYRYAALVRHHIEIERGAPS
jgi:citrate/tricarballylate utilization protein